MSQTSTSIGLFEVLDRGLEGLKSVRSAAWKWALLVYLGTVFAATGLTGLTSVGLQYALGAQLASWWVVAGLCLLGTALLALHLLSILLVGAAVIPALELQAGDTLGAQDVVQQGLQHSPSMLGLWAQGLSRLGLIAGFSTAALVALLVAFSAQDVLSQAIIGVLAALILTLVSAVSGMVLVGRFALSWPILVIHGGTVSEAMQTSGLRLKGRALLVNGLVLLLWGLSGSLVLGLAVLVPSPEIIDLSRAELIQHLPELVRTQLWIQSLASGVVVAVAVYGSACFWALFRLTTEE